MRATRPFALLVTLAIASAAVLHGQSRRPQAQLTSTVEAGSVAPGGETQLLLQVKLPTRVHVQSNKPKDPLFIPTELTVAAPKGVTVASVVFPPSEELTQAGLKEPLIVFGNEFTVRVRVKVARDARPGPLAVPGKLRYQACDETTCYPPATADVSWALQVSGRKTG